MSTEKVRLIRLEHRLIQLQEGPAAPCGELADGFQSCPGAGAAGGSLGGARATLLKLGQERMRAALPGLEQLDQLIYKTAGVAFAGLGMLLVTGAV